MFLQGCCRVSGLFLSPFGSICCCFGVKGVVRCLGGLLIWCFLFVFVPMLVVEALGDGGVEVYERAGCGSLVEGWAMR
jgi:hypothetical protein